MGNSNLYGYKTGLQRSISVTLINRFQKGQLNQGVKQNHKDALDNPRKDAIRSESKEKGDSVITISIHLRGLVGSQHLRVATHYVQYISAMIRQINSTSKLRR